MPNITAMLAAAHDIKAQLDVLLLRGRVQDSGEHRVAATLCLTIAEQFAATLHLIEGGFSSHAPVMVRSMLEGHAYLLNVVSDPAFVDQIRYDNARADVVLFTEYAADPAMQDNTEAQETLAKWKAVAFLIYLNTVPLGGETEFPNAGVKVAAVRGNACFFSYCDAEGQLDPRTLHSGNAVIEGDKWIAVKWLREGRVPA